MTDHLARAKEYIGRGEEFYRKAAAEIIAAQAQDHSLSNAAIGLAIGKSEFWVRKIVQWSTTAIPGSDDLPFGGETKRESVDRSATRKTLRDSTPEQIAEILSEPRVRANVAKAQDIAYSKVERESREKQRESVGEETSERLDAQQRLHDAEAEIFKARRGLIETLRILNEVGADTVPDSWREEFLRTLDDIAAKIEVGRAFLSGSFDDALDELLGAQS